MRFHELLLLVDFDEVVDKIVDIYYSENEEKDVVRKNYLYFLENLIDGREPKCSDITIQIDYVESVTREYNGYTWTDDEYWHVYGTSQDDDSKWALEFSPFDEWLGFSINQAIFSNLSRAEAVAHCVWEMTFVSFDETEIAKKIEEINASVDEIMEEIKEKEL